ncbi:MAG: hypothetical protein RI932_1089 [Pseudomonadota bacterium]
MLSTAKRMKNQSSRLRPLVPLMATLSGLYLASCGNPNENRAGVSAKQGVQNESSVVKSSAGDVKRGLVKLYGNWTPMTYEDFGNYALVEGHMRIPKGSFKELDSASEKSLGLLAQGNGGQIATEYLWPNMTVPYSLAADLDNRAKENFGSAIAMYHASTPIRFRPATSADRDVLEVIKNNESGCGWAWQGRQLEVLAEGYPRNVMALTHTDACLNDPRNVGLIAHELAHAIGLGHEFSRPDRASFIRIVAENVNPPRGFTLNDLFPVVSARESFVFGPFDLNSITMYGPFIFSLAKQKHLPVITDINGKINFSGNVSLSSGDMRGIAKLYESQGAPTLKAAIADQDLGLNQTRTLDFEVVNIPSCANVTVDGGSVTQKSSSPTQCSLSISAGGVPGYFDVTIALFKEMVTRRVSDGFVRSRLMTVGDSSKPTSIERFRVKVGNPTQAPRDIKTNILSALGERSLFIGSNIAEQRGILQFETLSEVMGDEHFYLVSGQDASSFVVLGNVLTSAIPLTKDRYQVQITSTNRAGLSVTKPFEFFTKLPQQRNITVFMNGYNSLQYRIDSSNSLCRNPPADPSASSVWIKHDLFQSLMPNIQISNTYGRGLGNLIETQTQQTTACVTPTPTPSQVERATPPPAPAPAPSPIQVTSTETFVCPNFLNLTAPAAGLSFSPSRAMQNGRTVSVSGSANNIVNCALSFAAGEYEASRTCKRYGRSNNCLEYNRCVETIELSVLADAQQHEMWKFPTVGTATRISGCRYRFVPTTINVSTTANMTYRGLSLQYQNCRPQGGIFAECDLKNPGDTYSCTAGDQRNGRAEVSCRRN